MDRHSLVFTLSVSSEDELLDWFDCHRDSCFSMGCEIDEVQVGRLVAMPGWLLLLDWEL